MSEAQLFELTQQAMHMQWNKGVPGGFTTNTPQRKVNAFGNGTGYSETLEIVGDAWSYGYWTAARNQNNATLVTELEPLPDWLKKIGLYCRHKARDLPGYLMSDFTYNIAVCNMYDEHTNEIKEHTDDNPWYTVDCPYGPHFASLTLYPTGSPNCDDEYANFQIKENGIWRTIKLDHGSILIMPSCIPHRVTKSSLRGFKSRINITLRSVPDPKLNALHSLQGSSNHARYYRIPCALHICEDTEITENLSKVKAAFDDCCVKHTKDKLTLVRTITKSARSAQRKQILRRIDEKIHFNTVTELLMQVDKRLA